MQPTLNHLVADGRAGFNPHPSRRTGATFAIPVRSCCSTSFNPHPSRRTGATKNSKAKPRNSGVSILTRPEGRVQRSPDNLALLIVHGFNPHPSRRTGATNWRPDMSAAGLIVSILTRPEGRVQRLSATNAMRPLSVSILTRPEGRVQQSSSSNMNPTCLVSILTRPEGRVQRFGYMFGCQP